MYDPQKTHSQDRIEALNNNYPLPQNQGFHPCPQNVSKPSHSEFCAWELDSGTHILLSQMEEFHKEVGCHNVKSGWVLFEFQVILYALASHHVGSRLRRLLLPICQRVCVFL